MEAERFAFIVAYSLPVIGLILAARLPDQQVKLGYGFVLLTWTVAVAALQLSRDLWSLFLVPVGCLVPTVVRHWFSRQNVSTRGERR